MFNIIPDTEAFNERYTVIYPLGEFIVRLPDGQEVSLIPTKFVNQETAERIAQLQQTLREKQNLKNRKLPHRRNP